MSRGGSSASPVSWVGTETALRRRCGRSWRPASVGDYEMPGWVNIEVPMGMSPADAVFQDRINRVYDALARKGWNSARNLPKPDGTH